MSHVGAFVIHQSSPKTKKETILNGNYLTFRNKGFRSVSPFVSLMEFAFQVKRNSMLNTLITGG